MTVIVNWCCLNKAELIEVTSSTYFRGSVLSCLLLGMQSRLKVVKAKQIAER